jgi:type IV pilus assembly protein PilM
VLAGLLNTATHPIGVEVTDREVRMLQLRRVKGALTVAGVGHASLPPLPADDIDGRTRTLGEAIQRILSHGSFYGRSCVSCFPTAHLTIHSIRMPAMPDDELNKAIRYEAEERFNISPYDSEIGFLRLGEIRQGDDSRHEVILVVSPHETATAHLDALVAAGLRPRAIDTSFCATARAFSRAYRRQSDQDKVRLVLQVGCDSTQVLILQGCRVGFFRTSDIGGRQFDDAVAAHLGIDLSEAADLRRRRIGRPDEVDSSIDRALLEATRPLMLELAHEAALCQRYYSVTFRGAVPDFVLLSGFDGREPHFADVVAEELKLTTQVGKPLENVDSSAAGCAIDRRSDMTEWAVATGLSLRSERFEPRAAKGAPKSAAPVRKEAA